MAPPRALPRRRHARARRRRRAAPRPPRRSTRRPAPCAATPRMRPPSAAAAGASRGRAARPEATHRLPAVHHTVRGTYGTRGRCAYGAGTLHGARERAALCLWYVQHGRSGAYVSAFSGRGSRPDPVALSEVRVLARARSERGAGSRRVLRRVVEAVEVHAGRRQQRRGRASTIANRALTSPTRHSTAVSTAPTGAQAARRRSPPQSSGTGETGLSFTRLAARVWKYKGFRIV